MKKLFGVMVLLSAIGLTGCATAPAYGNGEYRQANAPRTVTQTYYVDARVVDVKPAPQICDYGRKKSDKSSPLLGGLIGGLIGNQFGKGKGRVFTTIGGTAVGAMMATERDPRKTGKVMKCKSDGYLASVQYMHPVSGQFVFTEIPMAERIRLNRRQDTYVSIPVKVEQYR